MRARNPVRSPFRGLLRAALLLPLVAGLAGCRTSDGDVTNIVDVGGEAVENRPEVVTGAKARTVRDTSESVKRYEELRFQGQDTAALALRNAIATSVDKEFEIYRDMAVKGEMYLHRNMALRCLGFARENRVAAREAVLVIASDRDEQPFLRANAMRALGFLEDPDTPLEPVVAMLGSGDAAMRTEAARTYGELIKSKETPRELTAQYLTALQRLATMLYDKANRPGRQAAVLALGNMRHPDTLQHLLAALGDGDDLVQIGALRGLWLLGDQRAIDPILAYLRDGASSSAESWAVKTLTQIATQAGFTKEASVPVPVEPNARKWEEYFRDARMK